MSILHQMMICSPKMESQTKGTRITKKVNIIWGLTSTAYVSERKSGNTNTCSPLCFTSDTIKQAYTWPNNPRNLHSFLFKININDIWLRLRRGRGTSTTFREEVTLWLPDNISTACTSYRLILVSNKLPPTSWAFPLLPWTHIYRHD